ncbi:MAG: hypothetical protein ACR2PT_07240 [Endozoicomonas sp.]
MRHFISLLVIILKIRLMPDWMQDQTPDSQHFYRRTFTRSYKAKKGLVRNLWIGAGLLVLLNPVLPVLLLVALPTTFLSFLILDETS